MLIRSYTDVDQSGCLTVFNSNVPVFFAASEANDFVAWLNAVQNQATHADKTPRNYYYVIEHNASIVASGGFHIPQNGKPVTLAWGMVDHALHKQGLGLALLRFRIEKIEKLAPKRDILLDTTQYSYRFFEKFEFRTIKVTPDYYTTGLDRYDMVRYSK